MVVSIWGLWCNKKSIEKTENVSTNPHDLVETYSGDSVDVNCISSLF